MNDKYTVMFETAYSDADFGYSSQQPIPAHKPAKNRFIIPVIAVLALAVLVFVGICFGQQLDAAKSLANVRILLEEECPEEAYNEAQSYKGYWLKSTRTAYLDGLYEIISNRLDEEVECDDYAAAANTVYSWRNLLKGYELDTTGFFKLLRSEINTRLQEGNYNDISMLLFYGDGVQKTKQEKATFIEIGDSIHAALLTAADNKDFGSIESLLTIDTCEALSKVRGKELQEQLNQEFIDTYTARMEAELENGYTAMGLYGIRIFDDFDDELYDRCCEITSEATKLYATNIDAFYDEYKSLIVSIVKVYNEAAAQLKEDADYRLDIDSSYYEKIGDLYERFEDYYSNEYSWSYANVTSDVIYDFENLHETITVLYPLLEEFPKNITEDPNKRIAIYNALADCLIVINQHEPFNGSTLNE